MADDNDKSGNDKSGKSVLAFPNAPTPGGPADTPPPPSPPIKVLLLDDREENLVLRSAILRMHGYEAITCHTVADAQKHLHQIDIAVLDYHLGAGIFGTEVANSLRAQRPEVPIIILSATLERHFGGVEDMHLLKGYSSVDDLINALRSFEAKRRGRPVVVDARDFFYSRIQMAVGDNVVLEILDAQGNWIYVNELAAQVLGHERIWFADHNLFEALPALASDWREILENVALTRETYIDRTNRGLLNLPTQGDEWVWSIIAFPISLHDNRPGVVIMARTLERKPQI
jgi:two-component system OmpR family response regulator